MLLYPISGRPRENVSGRRRLAHRMPFLRFSRDKRGYANTYLCHTFREDGALRMRVLYWFRTPPDIDVGRPALDADAIRDIEASNPGLTFDWDEILKAKPPPDRDLDGRDGRERRSRRRGRGASARGGAAAAEPPRTQERPPTPAAGGGGASGAAEAGARSAAGGRPAAPDGAADAPVPRPGRRRRRRRRRGGGRGDERPAPADAAAGAAPPAAPADPDPDPQ